MFSQRGGTAFGTRRFSNKQLAIAVDHADFIEGVLILGAGQEGGPTDCSFPEGGPSAREREPRTLSAGLDSRVRTESQLSSGGTASTTHSVR
jgi:hypothetical protein